MSIQNSCMLAIFAKYDGFYCNYDADKNLDIIILVSGSWFRFNKKYHFSRVCVDIQGAIKTYRASAAFNNMLAECNQYFNAVNATT